MHLDTVYLCAVSEDSFILLLEVTEQVKLRATSPCCITTYLYAKENKPVRICDVYLDIQGQQSPLA